MGQGARLAEAGSHAELLAKSGKYAAFVSHLDRETSEQIAAIPDAERVALGAGAGGAALELQTELQATAATLQREIFGVTVSDSAVSTLAASDGAAGTTPSPETARPVPMALLQTVSDLRRTLQQIEDASARRWPLGDGALQLTLSKTSSSQPGSAPGPPRADFGLSGIDDTGYRSPR